MIFSENRYPPPGQARGQAFSGSCLERPSLGLKIHGDAVDAIAQMRRRGAVVEYVAQVASATAAVHLGADHAVGAVGRRFNRARDRIVEARPAGAALELSFRDE